MKAAPYFHCEACDTLWSYSDDAPTKCPTCGTKTASDWVYNAPGARNRLSRSRGEVVGVNRGSTTPEDAE